MASPEPESKDDDKIVSSEDSTDDEKLTIDDHSAGEPVDEPEDTLTSPPDIETTSNVLKRPMTDEEEDENCEPPHAGKRMKVDEPCNDVDESQGENSQSSSEVSNIESNDLSEMPPGDNDSDAGDDNTNSPQITEADEPSPDSPISNNADINDEMEENYDPVINGDDRHLVNGNTVDENTYVNGDDSSTVKSDDSEKENIDRQCALDLSEKSSDIITLSDDSGDDRSMDCNGILPELSKEEMAIKKRMIKKLQANLRNEEAKLVLLKKLQQSQMLTQLQDHSNTMPMNNSAKQSSQSRSHGQPPPLIRGVQNNIQQKPQSHSNVPPQLMRGQRNHIQGPPPLVMTPRMAQRGMARGSAGSALSNMISGGYRGGGQSLPQPQQAPPPPAEMQTPAQRQAAAKLALRKQLEKTLLQIPPPKPPPPEMNFIPSLGSNEFMMLLGLEEVVNFITDCSLIARGEKNADEKLVCNPFTCVQCHTDFTPVWKRDKPQSKNVICEHCVTSNQKKALKQEHTNRLKSAFVKALQQEQEIERMQSQASTVAVTTTTATTFVTTAPMNLSTTVYKPSSEQMRQHQNLLHAHQLRAGQPLGLQAFNQRASAAPNPYHYQIPYTKPTDIQRQYLLDMIPRSGINMGWKT